MPKVKKKEESYKVKNKDIFLNLFVGDGQFGRTDLILDGEQILRVTGDITNLRLGSGAELKAKELRINTLGVDVNTDTNRLGITYELKGGDGLKEFESTDKVASDFGSILFMTTVFFH
jgi:hypothetical protein